MADQPDAPEEKHSQHLFPHWQPPPRLPTFTGELGNGPVEDFIMEAERVIKAYRLSDTIAIELILRHLGGQARREVLAQPQTAVHTVARVLQILRSAFGEQCPVPQLLTAFHCRRQQPAETVLEYSHALQTLARRIRLRDPTAVTEHMLRDRFCEELEDVALKRDLKRIVREGKEVTLNDLRQEALRWVHEEGPREEAVYLQRQVAAASDFEKLSAQVAKLCEDLQAMKTQMQNRAVTTPPTTEIARPFIAFRRKPQLCFNCQQPGHLARDCPHHRGNKRGGN